ncbi:TniQ family protein [Pseudomonas syringae]|uniref:TniQ family protein n=1 Tax=Pseudomonas syringae TaxID=317 RepID=UPI002A765E8A|nr:TniQ family protein [Pseudomonas syringae]MDY2562264.1 TniQ family protein [Pseudomonas syringae]
MGRRWIGSSANQAPLESVLELIGQYGGDTHGKLIIVRGEAGAGASAFASRLHSMLLRKNIRSVFVPRFPFNADFVFSSHFLKPLGLPSSSVDMISGRKVRLHYEAAIHLRRYQAVICEDAHDFFHKRQMKVENIYGSIQQLTQPPYSHCVVLCGLRDPLTAVGHVAQAMGMDVKYVDLEPMPCDQYYLKFVHDIATGIPGNRINPFLLSTTAESRAGAPPPASEPREALNPQSAPAPIPADSDLAAEQTDLGASSFLALDPCPLTMYGFDLGILHAHTKGLIGNTVTVVRGLLAASVTTCGSTNYETSDSRPLPLSDAFPNQPASAERAEQQEVAQEAKGAEETKQAKQAKQAEAAISSIGSIDDELSHSSDAALGQPARSEELLIPKSEPGSDDLFMCQADASDTPHGMQIRLPFALGEYQQIEVQLELSLVIAIALTDQPVTSGGATEKGLSVSSASDNSRYPCNKRSTSIDLLTSGSRKRRRAFSDYLTPLHDETLGSWLSRNAASSAVTVIHDGFLDWCTELLQPTVTQPALASAHGLNQLSSTKNAVARLDVADEYKPWNPEVLLGNPRSQDHGQNAKDLEWDDLYRSTVFLKAFPDLTSAHMTERFRLPSNAVNQHDNRRFCAQCLAEDVATMRAPGLRRAWRNRGSALCAAHRQPVLLQQLEKGHLSNFTGGWQAYMQQTTRGYFDHGVGLVSRDGAGYQTASLETTICRIVLRIQIWVEYAPALPSGGHPSKYALYFLLGIFLYEGNLVCDGGAARWFLKAARGSKLNSHEYDKPTVAQMVKNIESASPRSLAIAYLLLGSAFDLLRAEELCLIRRALIFTDSFFPVTREELKSLTRCFQPYHRHAIWNSALQNLPVDDLVHLAWLLRGS